MFPGDTDPAFPGQTWTEQTAGNVPDDRRFLQTAGKFTSSTWSTKHHYWSCLGES